MLVSCASNKLVSFDEDLESVSSNIAASINENIYEHHFEAKDYYGNYDYECTIVDDKYLVLKNITTDIEGIYAYKLDTIMKLHQFSTVGCSLHITSLDKSQNLKMVFYRRILGKKPFRSTYETGKDPQVWFEIPHSYDGYVDENGKWHDKTNLDFINTVLEQQKNYERTVYCLFEEWPY